MLGYSFDSADNWMARCQLGGAMPTVDGTNDSTLKITVTCER
jgi:hypothetical protein